MFSGVCDMRDTIFSFNGQVIDVNKLIKDNFDIIGGTIFFMGIKLQGSSENEQEPLWFGQLKNGELDRSRPVYYLIGDKDSESQVLKVFIGNNTLLIRDYSILESSLGIKLEVKSKEAEQILNQEQEKSSSRRSHQAVV